MLPSQSVTGTWPAAIRKYILARRWKNADFALVRAGSVFFCIEITSFSFTFGWFWYTIHQESKTWNSKNEHVLIHFCTLVDGEYFLPYQDRQPHFFVLILSRIWTRFGLFLPDFSDPADRCHQVYEWSSEHVKMHNFHHFLKRFWHPKNRAPANVSWISWKMRPKLFRKK